MRRLNAETAEGTEPDAAPGLRDRTGDTREGRGGGLRKRFVAQTQAAQAEQVRRTGRAPPVEDTRYVLQGLKRSKPQTSRVGRRRDRRTCGFIDPECPGAARHQGPWVRRSASCA